ncbi:glycosyltransferase [Haliea sp. E1-2-M8]|uniref:glycosyltransferase n=1 Tax=Haliea sp. E1-2-M8 TaxID=3064706 RepID=UPI002721D3E7|nr:glycosyltransferase [Haliea sp. E1-2-M8]MDO8861112.1 glycosyltransferase [Haliea sp. E1-2-M8]
MQAGVTSEPQLDRTLRALHLGKYYPPHHGGMETYLRDLLVALGELGVRCTALVHRSERSLRSTEDTNIAGEERPRIVRAAVWATVLFAPLSPAFPLQLAKMVKDEQPDLLHIHMPNLSAFWALLLPSARKLPWVIHWHADVPLTDHSAALRLIYRFFYRPLERRLLRRADVIVATSPPYLESSPALQQFRDKAVVVPLGLGAQAQNASRESNAITPSSLRFIAIGRLTYYKGFSVLLQALADCPDTTLDLIGEGSERAALEHLATTMGISHRVTLHGALPDPNMQALLANADVMCLPSIERTEAFGMVLLEAMAQGKACVATAVPGTGMAWVVKHGETGLIVPPNDVGALAATLSRLAADRSLVHRLGAAGKMRFVEKFQIERSAKGILQIYRQSVPS